MASNNTALPRMRLLKQFYDELKKDDPQTSFTPHSIRSLGLQGKIPCCTVGNRRLYNYDAFLEILATDPERLSIDIAEAPLTAPLLPVRKLPGRTAR